MNTTIQNCSGITSLEKYGCSISGHNNSNSSLFSQQEFVQPSKTQNPDTVVYKPSPSITVGASDTAHGPVEIVLQ
jgi:hypothetical protein